MDLEACSFAPAGDQPHEDFSGGPSSGVALEMDDMLELPLHKRMVVQYGTDEESGARELRLFYGEKEISFDEPDLFAFGETLAKQSRFRAGDALHWTGSTDWPRFRELFLQLIDEGVLRKGAADSESTPSLASRERPSPLPPATCPFPRSWRDSEAITRELTGHRVEPGYLEVFIPIFRVAHTAIDADGRQVGEANVFPRQLRVDMPTTWLTCIYPGTRYRADAPMNATALRAMREHWGQMMAALLRIRAAFLSRSPVAKQGWTVGDVERLATTVLAVTTYQVTRWDRTEKPAPLHPALSSLFRVTDGLRMVMHQMLFVPFGEPTLSPDDPVTPDQIHDYAERNYSFHSGSGVCAGPRIMVQEFLNVLLEGSKVETYGNVSFDRPVEDALSYLDEAMDYGLLGLQTYAVTFSLWPMMTRTYEQLADLCSAAVAAGAMGFETAAARMEQHRESLRTSPYLAREVWRADRDHVYADMHAKCGALLRSGHDEIALPDLLARRDPVRSAAARADLSAALVTRFCRKDADRPHAERITDAILEYVLRTQAILRGAQDIQDRINALLGRPTPKRPLEATDLDVHNRLQGADGRRLPYLLDEIAATFQLQIHIDSGAFSVTAQTSEGP